MLNTRLQVRVELHLHAYACLLLLLLKTKTDSQLPCAPWPSSSSPPHRTPPVLRARASQGPSPSATIDASLGRGSQSPRGLLSIHSPTELHFHFAKLPATQRWENPCDRPPRRERDQETREIQRDDASRIRIIDSLRDVSILPSIVALLFNTSLHDRRLATMTPVCVLAASLSLTVPR